MGCHFLLQGIFLTQGLNSGLPHCRQTLYRLNHQGGSQINFFFKGGLEEMREEGRSRGGYNVSRSLEVGLTGPYSH